MSTKKFVVEFSEDKPPPTFIQKTLSSMGYEHKFYLVFALISSSLFVTIAFLATAYLEDLRFLESEIAGIHAQEKVENVLENVIAHKILSYRYNNGDAELKKELIELQGTISKDISTIPSPQLQNQWEEYTNLAFHMRAEENDAFHITFVDSLQELLNLIGESSNLSYDYQPESHHLIQMNLWLIPDLQDIASQLLILSHTLSKKESLTPVDINKLITLTTVLKGDLSSLKQQYEKSKAASYTNEITTPYNALQEAGKVFLAHLEDLTNSQKRDIGLYSDINLAGLKFLSKADQLFGSTLKQVGRLVEERYTALKNKALLIALFVIFLITIASLFTFFVVKELNSYLTKTYISIARFRHGDLKARAPDAYDKTLQKVSDLLNELGDNYERLMSQLQISGEQLASVSEETLVNKS